MINWCDKHGPYQGTICPTCPVQDPQKPTVHFTGALDLAKLHDYSAMIDGEVSYHKAVVKGIKIWPHVDYTIVVGDVSARYKKTNMELLGFDETGVGEPIKEMLYYAGVQKAEGLKFGEYIDYVNPWGEREHAPIKYAIVEYSRACMQAGWVDRPTRGASAKELTKQLGEQEIKPTSTDRVQYAHPQGQHDDLAWAFMMWLYVSRHFIGGNGVWAKVVQSGTPEYYKEPYPAYRR